MPVTIDGSVLGVSAHELICSSGSLQPALHLRVDHALRVHAVHDDLEAEARKQRPIHYQ